MDFTVHDLYLKKAVKSSSSGFRKLSIYDDIWGKALWEDK